MRTERFYEETYKYKEAEAFWRHKTIQNTASQCIYCCCFVSLLFPSLVPSLWGTYRFQRIHGHGKKQQIPKEKIFMEKKHTFC